MSIGWKLRDAEPSDAYLWFSRVSGGVVSLISLIVIIAGFVHGGHSSTRSVSTHTNGVSIVYAWVSFEKEMTVNNIDSIRDAQSGQIATPTQVKTFVSDIESVTDNRAYQDQQGTTYSSIRTFVVTCKDGYTASIMEHDSSGSFGVATGSYEAIPSHVFTSTKLAAWANTVA